MDREGAMLDLPTGHAVALRLRDAGADDDTIAKALGVPVEAVPGLLVIADGKLAALLDPRRRSDASYP
jgi:hypothetical protein